MVYVSFAVKMGRGIKHFGEYGERMEGKCNDWVGVEGEKKNVENSVL